MPCATTSASARRLGVASTFLAERIAPGEPIKVYVQKAHAFGLPADPDVPIIMIGPGTGVAPFRAFLQERMATKAPGRNWLFFGHQRSDYDFFYEDEFKAMKASGVLTRLSLAWSRDGDQKIYVQDRMREVGRDLWAWLADGAHIYVCGDAKRMAKDVETRAGRYRRPARRAHADEAIGVRRRPEESRAATSRTSIDERARAASAGRAHHLPLLRRRLRRAGEARRARRRGDRGRSRSSGEFRPALLEGLGARRDARRSTRACCIRCCGRADGALARTVVGRRARSRSPTALSARSRSTGPDAVAFYLSGQLLTEDYYVANKLMKGFIGSANVDTNSRLCMASSVAGHRRAFGADTVPGTYEDLDRADLIVLVGSNAAWCHPVLYQRMVANKRERGAKIVVIDPRRTATAEDADLFLPIAPGMDTALFCGLLVHLADTHALDSTISTRTRRVCRRRWRARARSRPTSRRPRAATGLARSRRRALLRAVPRDARTSSPAFRKA